MRMQCLPRNEDNPMARAAASSPPCHYRCGGAPARSLRESFAAQMAANGFIKDFSATATSFLHWSRRGRRRGEWRAQRSATIEPNSDQASRAAAL
jgi:hypothetical protein